MNKFHILSLGDWLTLATATGVPIVPAELVYRLPVESVMNFDMPSLRDKRELMNLSESLNNFKKSGKEFMFRWDCCASEDVKYRLSCGKTEWSEDYMNLFIDDTRLFDIIFDMTKKQMDVWARPWLIHYKYKSFPVEYRVYVDDGKILGISNYYPQRDLPNTYPFCDDVTTCINYTNALLKSFPKNVVEPQILNTLKQTTTPAFTVDFMKTEDCRLLLLEGGPPSTTVWGAHACCFAPDQITGIALAKRPGCVLM